jgi:hypothetical protein
MVTLGEGPIRFLSYVKQLTAISLLVMLLMLSFRDAGIYLAFRYNQAWILENKCENQSRPEMKCNGACFLKKQLAEDSRTNDSVPKQAVEKLEIVIYAIPGKVRQVFDFAEVAGQATMLSDVHFDSDPHLRQVFHPPQERCLSFANA